MDNLGAMLKRQRVMIPLTLQKLAVQSGVSQSHLFRIERGSRFPSAHILRKIAKPLGFDEDELFMLAGYLSRGAPTEAKESHESYYNNKRLDPYVAKMLAQQPIETQRAVIGILNIFKSLLRNTVEK